MNDKTRTNPKPQYGAQAGKRGLLLRFTIFMAWVAGIGLLLSLVTCKPASAKPIATDDSSGYHSLTTKHSAAKPSRHSLAIFVPKTDLINTQQVTTGTNNSVTSSYRYTYGTGHSDVSYDGISEPNTIPLVGNKFRRLNAVVNVPFIPFSKKYPTHTKHSGGYHA
ncbi:hypothetical protein ACTXLK_05045 [Psychrobacter faecalis]